MEDLGKLIENRNPGYFFPSRMIQAGSTGKIIRENFLATGWTGLTEMKQSGKM